MQREIDAGSLYQGCHRGGNHHGEGLSEDGQSEQEAKRLFQEKLKRAVDGSNIIYVIADPEHIALLPEAAIRILVSADLDTIKERFSARMHGVLPGAVERMLESKHGMFDNETFDYCFDGVSGDAAALCGQLMNRSSLKAGITG